jgi:hypothetical protein
MSWTKTPRALAARPAAAERCGRVSGRCRRYGGAKGARRRRGQPDLLVDGVGSGPQARGRRGGGGRGRWQRAAGQAAEPSHRAGKEGEGRKQRPRLERGRRERQAAPGQAVLPVGPPSRRLEPWLRTRRGGGWWRRGGGGGRKKACISTRWAAFRPRPAPRMAAAGVAGVAMVDAGGPMQGSWSRCSPRPGPSQPPRGRKGSSCPRRGFSGGPSPPWRTGALGPDRRRSFGARGQGSEWVPQSRGWRRDPLYIGDEEEFLVHGEKERRG